MLVVRSEPAKDRFISNDELRYIQSAVSVCDVKKRSIPWKSLLLSKPVYAITAAHTTDTWGFYTMLTQMPSFLFGLLLQYYLTNCLFITLLLSSDALNYDLENSGFLSAAPYLTMSIAMFFSGILADVLQNKKHLTTTQIRKYYCCTTFIIQMVCMLTAGFLIHPVWSVVLIIIGVGVGGFSLAGYSYIEFDF